MKSVLITGLNKEFDRKLALIFSRNGFKVFAMGSEKIEGIILLPPEHKDAAAELKKGANFIDIYIDVSDERSESDNFDVRSGINEQVMRELYDANVIKPMAMLETFFPLLEAGEYKRLCFLTSAEASINETQDKTGYGYKMAKAGLHNFLQITRNVLAPKHYTIRAFDPCLAAIGKDFNSKQKITGKKSGNELSAEAAFNYFTRGRGVERGDPQRDDETNLVFRDAYGRQHPW
ncbi:MAG: hypothetical protein FWC21_01650 [Treponema sp.]|nr:hypothetical protein [Treponema sp.]